MRDLYTVILQLGEASSVTQREAADVRRALAGWLGRLERVTIVSSLDRQLLRSNLLGGQPVRVSGVRNVWYVNTSIKSGHAQVHIVKTSRTGMPGLSEQPKARTKRSGPRA
jgi:hypothetical protein